MSFIVEDVWSDLNDFKNIHRALLKSGFKVFYKKIVLYKKIKAHDEQNKLVFKTIKDAGANLFYKIYNNFIKESESPDFSLDKADIKKSFSEILSKKNNWNFIAFDSKNHPVGLLILDQYHNYYTTNIILVSKHYRKKGYSYELLKKAESEFSKAGKLKLWYESTWEKDTPMIKAFKAYGFSKKRILYYYIRP